LLVDCPSCMLKQEQEISLRMANALLVRGATLVVGEHTECETPLARPSDNAADSRSDTNRRG
jgi:hypothetical protein